jgi:dihydrofolate reductase
MKCTIHIATSLDGYIADAQGGIDWLENASHDPGVFERILPFIEASEVVVMGRLTYETCLRLGDWPYGGKKCIVVSSQNLSPSSPDTAVVRIEDLFAAMVATGAQNVWIVGGGQLNAYLMDQGLIDELIVTVVPVVLGNGIQLFSTLAHPVALKLREAHTLVDGFVELSYVLPRPC